MRIILNILILLFANALIGQSDLFASLHDQYSSFKEDRLVDRRFKHSDISPIINNLPSLFTVKEEGESVEGRAIYSIRIGQGAQTVLLWSQMHGDEPTATAALFDIFRFFQAENDGFDELRERLLKELTIVFIPMLNPDGTAHFSRRNALGIDLNRDALRLSSPETQILKRVRDELDADWGFNLHDQSRFYGAGYPTDNMATLAFLAPAYDFERHTNAGRERSMQMIAELNKHLQNYIPLKVARYSDAFEPRAFGDNMQKWGTSTILVESGSYPGDREKQYIRQLNFASILYAFNAFVSKSYRSSTKADYNTIPYNKGGAFNDLILREVTFEYEGYKALVDIAFDLQERDYNKSRQFYFKAKIDDVGDLSYSRAFQDLPAAGYTASIAGVYPDTINNMQDLQTLDINELLGKGIGVIRVKNLNTSSAIKAQLSVLAIEENGTFDTEIRPGSNPPLILRNELGVVVYAVINGQLIPVKG